MPDATLPRQNMKVCPKHGLTSYTDATKSRKYGSCRKCRVMAVTKRRAKVKDLAVAYKGGKCQHCLTEYPNAVLEFHHLDPSEKDFAIAAKGHCRSWDSVKKELDKCVMLCANCHRIEHLRIDNAQS